MQIVVGLGSLGKGGGYPPMVADQQAGKYSQHHAEQDTRRQDTRTPEVLYAGGKVRERVKFDGPGLAAELHQPDAAQGEIPLGRGRID